MEEEVSCNFLNFDATAFIVHLIAIIDRFALMLRTDASDVGELDLFPMKPGERRPPVPRFVTLLKHYEFVSILSY